MTICFCVGFLLPRFCARSNDGNDELPGAVWQLLLFVIWVPLNLSIQHVIDDLLFIKHQQEKNEARQQQRIAETDFWDEALSCPITLERMKDPVILFCYDRRQTFYGHVYDRQAICESLLAQPNLDPLSNTRYTAPLAYVPCRMRQAYLKCKNLYQAYDDTYFHADYQQAWNQLALRQENQALRAPGNNDARGNNNVRQPQAPEQNQVLPRELAEPGLFAEALRLLDRFQLQDELRRRF